MTAAAHTPGPWSVGWTRRANTDPRLTFFEAPIHVGEGESRGNCLAVVWLGGPGAIDCTEQAVEANARLMAAAPDMHAALRGLLRALDAADQDGLTAHGDEYQAALAALAKAEGGRR